MSLSAWEQQALDSIKDGLAGSDPQLAAMLTTFARLASAEDMPGQETITAGSRRKPRNLRWVMLVLLFVITGALITIAVVLSHGDGQGTCTGSWPPACSHSAPG
jgi:hypothetical protein